MVLLRRWIPSCVRRNSTHGIPSQLRSTPLTRGQTDSQQPRNLDILKRHKLLYWENSEEAKNMLTSPLSPWLCSGSILKIILPAFFLEELYTILSDIVWVMYHRLISFPVFFESDQTQKSAIVNNVFYECCPLPQGSQWQNETKT